MLDKAFQYKSCACAACIFLCLGNHVLVELKRWTSRLGMNTETALSYIMDISKPNPDPLQLRAFTAKLLCPFRTPRQVLFADRRS
jgi:hypothetical protein